MGSVMVLPKLLLFAASFVTLFLYTKIITFGTDPYKNLKGFRRKLVTLGGKTTARLTMYVANIFWIDIQRPSVDYKKYLGPEWTPKYRGASSVISNHSSWLDILAVFYV